MLLENACLIYGGGQREPNVRMLGTMVPGSPKPVTASNLRQVKNWLNDPFGKTNVIDENAEAIRGGVGVDKSGWLPVSMLFNELRVAAERPTNASLRHLDQSIPARLIQIGDVTDGAAKGRGLAIAGSTCSIRR